MTHTTRYATAAIALLALGCADVETDDTLETNDALETTPTFEEPDPAATPDGTAAAALGIDTLAGVGPYLTDGTGRALYLLEGEPRNESTCDDACARVWPPFLASQGAPRATADPVRPDLIGTFQREDGTTQVTYNGHALYYYQADQGPGDAEGQDVTDEWGEWYLVRPDGELLEEEGGEGGT